MQILRMTQWFAAFVSTADHWFIVISCRLTCISQTVNYGNVLFNQHHFLFQWSLNTFPHCSVNLWGFRLHSLTVRENFWSFAQKERPAGVLAAGRDWRRSPLAPWRSPSQQEEEKKEKRREKKRREEKRREEKRKTRSHGATPIHPLCVLPCTALLHH